MNIKEIEGSSEELHYYCESFLIFMMEEPCTLFLLLCENLTLSKRIPFLFMMLQKTRIPFREVQ